VNDTVNISPSPSNGFSCLIRSLVLAGVGLICWAAATPLQAASFSIDWYRISAGGGVSSNQEFNVAGSIGQHEAAGAAAMNGGSFALTGGFWSVVAAVQTPGAPRLTVSLSQSNAIVLTWPSGVAGFILQESVDLAPGGWTAVTNAVTTVNSVSQVGISFSNGYQFYRLVQPVR
jgi:hypothetical protein